MDGQEPEESEAFVEQQDQDDQPQEQALVLIDENTLAPVFSEPEVRQT